MLDRNNISEMLSTPRFVVFGVRVKDNLLIENHIDYFDNAVMMQEVTSTADYQARVWDKLEKCFIKQAVIDHAKKFLELAP